MNAKNYFSGIVAIIILTDLTTLLNIPFLRQILGFLFLTILPGLLVLQIFKLDKTDLVRKSLKNSGGSHSSENHLFIDSINTAKAGHACFLEKFILTWGLSISFLVFFGLLINNLSLSLGYETPLATIPLLILLNIVFITLAIIGYKMSKDSIFSLPNFRLTTLEKAFLIVPILFPALSIFGMYIMNTSNNNTILILLLFLIPMYVILVCFFNHKFPKRIYPVVIFLISMSLLFLMALRSNHIMGSDVHVEYYFFRTTLDNLHWKVFGHSALDACLSISLLPTIYQSILYITPEFLFKILYSFLFSISPIVVYVISKKYVGESYGFLASCFFMSQLTFLWTEYNPRTNIAIFFFALAMMVLFNDKIDSIKKRILFIIFMASCVVSHYSTTYIFFFIMFGTSIGIEILSKRYSVKKVVSLTMVLLFFIFIFFWYSQVTETAFSAGVRFIDNTISDLNKFFIEETRGQAQALLGKDIAQKGIPQKIEFMSTWLTLTFIGIGVITLIRRYKEMSFPEFNFKKPDFLKDKFEVAYFGMALACSGVLAAMVALPNVAVGYSMDRLYCMLTTILSVFFVIGGITLSQQTFKKSFTISALQVRAYLIILLVLIPHFLCVTGVMCNIFGVPRSVLLNSEGDQYGKLYVHDYESCSAKWWSEHKKEHQKIYADFYGGKRLVSQGKIPTTLINYYWLLEYEDANITIKNSLYLRHQNVVDGKLIDEYNEIHNTTDCQYLFNKKSTVYDAGCTKIYL